MNMVIARRITQDFLRGAKFSFGVCLALLVGSLVFAGCGESAKTVISPANGEVNAYFGGPFNNDFIKSESKFDHYGNQLVVSSFTVNQAAQVPGNIINGTFTAADTGFLAITEDFAITPGGPLTPQNPPLTGAWAVELPGAGALGNLLNINTSGTVSAAPVAMAQNTSCPDHANARDFLYVVVPNSSGSPDSADYGVVNLKSNGSADTFSAQPYLIGGQAQTASVVTGGCSVTNLGPLIAYPINSFGGGSNLELISVGQAGLLVSSFSVGQGAVPGAFGGGTGVIGVAVPTSPLDVSSVVALQYNGFIYSPRNTARQPSYDITVLASAFGNHKASSPECSALQSSLAANSGTGNGLVPTLPSPNSIYGGEFLSSTGMNDPSGSIGSEYCDVVIDLGAQDSTSNGLFPNAAIFISSTFPPFSTSNPWGCGGSACAVSFPATAVIGQVQGKYVIFISASGVSAPPAQLPDTSGSLSAQAVGIYLFQK